MTAAGEFTAFLAPAVRDAGQAGKLAGFTIADLGVRFFVPLGCGFGYRIFRTLRGGGCIVEAGADNDNKPAWRRL